MFAALERLAPEGQRDHVARTIKFICYELHALGANKDEPARFQLLNQFVFEKKDFRVGSAVLPQDFFESRGGCEQILALFYIELAKSLGLVMHCLNSASPSILRWLCSNGQSRYIDLSRKGQELSNEEILASVARSGEPTLILQNTELFVEYLIFVANHYRSLQDRENLHQVINQILEIETENTRYIVERALLRKDLGLTKEALLDFKRFFAFASPDSISPEIQRSFEDLKEIVP